MTKHTQDPWTSEGFTQTHGKGDFRGGLIIGADGESVVAQCVAENDAPIISAAPDLLNACKRLVSSILAHAETGEVHPPFTIEMQEAYAAINKAEQSAAQTDGAMK